VDFVPPGFACALVFLLAVWDTVLLAVFRSLFTSSADQAVCFGSLDFSLAAQVSVCSSSTSMRLGAWISQGSVVCQLCVFRCVEGVYR
jgi:hypothetical protein